MIKGIGECDEEIARFAYQNRCLAILGQDTDFVVYPGARHYWSIKNFDKHRMKTLEYSGARLASSLHLHYGHLPLLASLLGNDLIKREEIEVGLSQESGQEVVGLLYLFDESQNY